MKRIVTILLIAVFALSVQIFAQPEIVSVCDSAVEEIYEVCGTLTGDGIEIDLGSRVYETNKRYVEIAGVVTEIAENNDKYVVPVSDENLLIEIVEKDEAGNAVKSQYFFVDMAEKTALKLSMDSYMHAYEEKSIRVKDPMGIRFKSHIKTSPKFETTEFAIDEYGYVLTTKSALGNDELTLDFDVKVVGVAYNKQQNLDIVFDFDDEKHIFTAVLRNIPVVNYKTDLVCKTYTKITVGDEQFVLYGEPVIGNVFDIAKQCFVSDYTNEGIAKIVFDYISLAESENVSFTNTKLETSAKDGRIFVDGSFNNEGSEAALYNIYLVTYDENGEITKIEKSSDITMSNGANEFSCSFDIESKNQITKAFVLTSDLISICKPYDKTVKSLRLLSIGNSFSIDAQQWLYNIAMAGGYDVVSLGNLYIGGCSLKTHYENSVSGAAAYTFYKNANGTWITESTKTMDYGILYDDWDYITLQQNSGNSGAASTYDPYLTSLITYVNSKKTNPDAQLLWHMTWAYDESYASTSGYGSQSVMYERIIGATQQVIVPNSAFSMILPSGTAIQNARTSFIGDTFNRDGYHLDYNYGRYLAALTWYHKISGESIDDISYIPGNSFSKEYLEVIKESVKNAVLKPFEVTQSQYAKPSVDLEKDFVELEWEVQGLGYYNSISYSTPITTAANSKNFVYSKIFTKDELPVGTVLVIDGGYQYRPEGWVNLDTMNTASTRPDNVTGSMVIIDEDWWGSFNYRAFNVAVSGNGADLTDRIDEVASKFRIYIPKDKWQGGDDEEDEDDGEYEIEYVLTDWEPENASYYNSTGTDPDAKKTGDTLSLRFISSKIFTKEELPVGTIIEVDSGYAYRPEAWITLDTSNTSATRPVGVTTAKIVVDEAWWGDFNYRAFNLYLTSGANINEQFDEAITHLRIYVPTKKKPESTTPTGYIDWEPMKNLYYNSLGSSTPSMNEGNQNKFICSRIFTKDELPVGTVIEVDAGYQYRPEGWVELDTKNTVRPNNVTTSRIVIDESWWGVFNYRAFNLSKTDLSDICTDFDEAVTHFRIYVPLDNEIDIPVDDLYQ